MLGRGESLADIKATYRAWSRRHFNNASSLRTGLELKCLHANHMVLFLSVTRRCFSISKKYHDITMNLKQKRMVKDSYSKHHETKVRKAVILPLDWNSLLPSHQGLGQGNATIVALPPSSLRWRSLRLTEDILVALLVSQKTFLSRDHFDSNFLNWNIT